ncbi:MAG: beta-N-acetylhexosaminidase [Proteobacteria bacterium]|nr:beta-N-acetylhexosaminidase [Pseudomonadota bacterium]
MTLGPLMLDIEGPELTAEDRELLVHPLIGGVILFGRNYLDPGQLQKLSDDIHGLRTPALLVAVDQEGGRVQRFRKDFTGLPAAHLVGRQSDLDRKQGLLLAESCGWVMAAELRACGVDLSFAPVLDLDSGLSEVIGDRSFHSDPNRVAELAGAYMRAMKSAGMAAVGKHWPGHGAVSGDSHLALPRDRREYADILEDIIPFQKLADRGLAGVMAAHVVYPQLDLVPASFSSYWINDELRGKLRFNGVVFADDLSMQGAAGAGDLADRARAALAAGADMIMVCNDRSGAIRVVEELSVYDNPVSALRLTRLHGQNCATRDELFASERWQEAIAIINSTEHQPGLSLDA